MDLASATVLITGTRKNPTSSCSLTLTACYIARRSNIHLNVYTDRCAFCGPGGSSGIGLGLATRFVKAGSKVIVTGRRQQVLDEAKHQLPQLNTIVSDAGKASEREQLVRDLLERFPEVNVLVRCYLACFNIRTARPCCPKSPRTSPITAVQAAPAVSPLWRLCRSTMQVSSAWWP